MFYFFVVAVVLLPSVMATATFGVSKYLTIMRSVQEKDKDVALMLGWICCHTSVKICHFPSQ